MDVEFMCEPVNRLHGIFDHTLRAGDFFREICAGTARGFFQRQQPDIDPQQRLADVVVQLVAHSLAFGLLRRQLLVGQMPQLFLELMRFTQQLRVALHAFPERGFRRLALEEALLQMPVGGGESRGALRDRFVAPFTRGRRFRFGSQDSSDRSNGLGKKNFRALKPIVPYDGRLDPYHQCRQRGRVNPNQIQHLHSEGRSLLSQSMRPLHLQRWFLAQMFLQGGFVPSRQREQLTFHAVFEWRAFIGSPGSRGRETFILVSVSDVFVERAMG